MSRDAALLPPEAYAYLVGLYLGDGYIARHARTFRLRLAFDSTHRAVIEQAAAAMGEIAAPRVVDVFAHRGARCTEVRCYWRQRAITGVHPREFVRGLLHSDGCRCIATFRSRRPAVAALDQFGGPKQ